MTTLLSPISTELKVKRYVRDGKTVITGGIEWTITNGIPYHAPTLAADVRAMMTAARKGQNRERYRKL